jgi:LacI family transcriptional regulator
MAKSASPTVRKIAALAGVSRTTVSGALRNDPEVAVATRERICLLAKEHGYQLDPVVSSLMTRLRVSRAKRNLDKLAYLTFWGTATGWRENAHELCWFDGACKRANQLGYEIEDFWAKEPGMTCARLSKILYTRGLKGVIVGSNPQHIGHVSLNWQHFSCATLSMSILKPNLHRAIHNYDGDMLLALRVLRRNGYRRFGFANSALYDRRVDHGWLSRFLSFQYQIPLKQRIPPLLAEQWNGADDFGPPGSPNEKRFSAWFNRHRPDVILSNTLHPMVYCRRLGIRVPEDTGFASLHRFSEAEGVAGIDQMPERIGAAAVDLVVAQLQNNEFGLPESSKTLKLDGVWRNGPTILNKVRG